MTCHAVPHDARPCLDCHGARDTAARAVEARQHLRFAHRDHLPSLDGNCARCHQATDDRALVAQMGTCLGCHEHRADWEQRRCEQCHLDVAAEGLRPASHVVHTADYLARHGVDAASSRDLCASCHSERACARCHATSAPLLDARLRFDRPDTVRLHPAGFASRHALEAHAQPGICTSCHAIESCAECHRGAGVTATGALRRGPHPPGWVGSGRDANAHGPAARRDPLGCASCHGGAGEALCVSCHAVGGVGGSPHPPGWSSHKRTSEAPCRLCHL